MSETLTFKDNCSEMFAFLNDHEAINPEHKDPCGAEGLLAQMPDGTYFQVKPGQTVHKNEYGDLTVSGP